MAAFQVTRLLPVRHILLRNRPTPGAQVTIIFIGYNLPFKAWLPLANHHFHRLYTTIDPPFIGFWGPMLGIVEQVDYPCWVRFFALPFFWCSLGSIACRRTTIVPVHLGRWPAAVESRTAFNIPKGRCVPHRSLRGMWTPTWPRG